MNDIIINRVSLLRPEATKRFLKLLTKPMSVNLVAKTGTGQKRLFEDINKIKNDDTRIFYINLKNYAEYYDGFIRELSKQVLGNGQTEIKLSQIFENNSVQSILFINNYDAILNNKDIDSRYGVQFINDLNYIKNNNKVSLLCVTEKAHNTLPIFIDKKVYKNSWLDLENENLDNLTYNEIETELEQQLQPDYRTWLNLNQHIKHKLIQTIHNLNEENYNFLCYLAKEINIQNSEDDSLKFNDRLKLWIKNYKNQNKRSLKKRVYNCKRVIDEFKIILGIPKFSVIQFITNIISKLK